MSISAAARDTARDLLGFLDASPTPWHAVATIRRRLEQAGFRELREGEAWELRAGEAVFTSRGGSSLVAAVLGDEPPWEAGFAIGAAHTDSPGLRVKPLGGHARAGLLRLGVEIYGGPMLATWADRDLSLAGRVQLAAPEGLRETLVAVERPLLRIPTAAIHLNREVNDKGLLLHKQDQLPPILAEALAETDSARLPALLAEQLGVEAPAVLGFDLCVVDVQPAAFFGLDDEFIACGRLDNLAMCHALLLPLRTRAARPARTTAVAAFFDNEETGSLSTRGAAGTLLSAFLERLVMALGGGRPDWLRACARSFLISADMAHAVHPGHLERYEPQHLVAVNGGPAVKLNANLRYASDSAGTARFQRLCEQAGVPCQLYVHRSDLPCGSTIGPTAAAQLGIETVDVGNPMWSMHSVRESAGTADPAMMAAALGQFWSGEGR
jgi:aspartyl aminopeptidase